MMVTCLHGEGERVRGQVSNLDPSGAGGEEGRGASQEEERQAKKGGGKGGFIMARQLTIVSCT